MRPSYIEAYIIIHSAYISRTKMKGKKEYVYRVANIGGEQPTATPQSYWGVATTRKENQFLKHTWKNEWKVYLSRTQEVASLSLGFPVQSVSWAGQQWG